MEFSVIKKDLFTVDEEYSFAHCISFDCRMGKGIAKTFDRKYPKLKSSLILYLKSNKMSYKPTTIGYRVNDDRVVYNLITKPYYYDKPTYESLRETLLKLKEMLLKTDDRKIAMPKIGCGLDKLNWEQVELILKEIFNDMDIEILICEL